MLTRQKIKPSTGVITSSLVLYFCFQGVSLADDELSFECRYCDYDFSAQKSVEFGLTNISDQSHYFARYSGFDDDGTYPYLGADYAKRSEQGEFLETAFAWTNDDSIKLNYEQGLQGKYRWQFTFDKFPVWSPSTTLSPFRGIGGTQLLLPTNWIAAGTTSQMPLTEQALDFKLNRVHQNSQLNFDYQDSDNWRTGLKISRQENKGTRLVGASILTTSSLLPSPEQFTTDSVDAYLAYLQPQWQLRIGYSLSLFNNLYQTLSWENPFTEITPGSDQGQMSLAPDNEYQQLSLAFNYRFDKTQVNLVAGFGQGKQNDDFAPVTINALLASTLLPKDSLDGKVNTQNWRLKVNSHPWKDWRLSASYRYDERNNKTDILSFPQVVTDSYLSTEKVNIPYDFKRQQIDVKAGWRPYNKLRINAAVQNKETTRNFQEVDKTTENNHWLEAIVTPENNFDFRLKVTSKNRDGDKAALDDSIINADEPILQRFHTSDPKRYEVSMMSSYTPLDWLNVNLSFSRQKDDFHHTEYGLRWGENRITSVDFNFNLARHYSYGLFYSDEKQESLQMGLDQAVNRDWNALNQDTVASYGLNGIYQDQEVKWRIKAQLMASDFEGDSQVVFLGDEPAFPTLERRLTRFDLDAVYPLNDKTDIKLGYVYEKYRSSDWQQNFSDLARVPRLLSVGQIPPNYSLHLIAVNASYRF